MNYLFAVDIREGIDSAAVLLLCRCFLNHKIDFLYYFFCFKFLKIYVSFVPSSFSFCGSTVSSVLNGTEFRYSSSAVLFLILVSTSSALQFAVSCSL